MINKNDRTLSPAPSLQLLLPQQPVDQRSDLPCNPGKHFLISSPVVTVHFTDVAAVSDLTGIGCGEVAYGGGRAVGRGYEAGEIEKAVFSGIIAAK